jgi:hypothetical protein
LALNPGGHLEYGQARIGVDLTKDALCGWRFGCRSRRIQCRLVTPQGSDLPSVTVSAH